MKTSSKEVKRELFVQYYLEHHNITRAYKQAGFSPNDANANRYFHRKDVQEAIEHYVATQLKKLDINIERTLKHLAAIAYGNPLDVISVDGDNMRFKELNELPPWVAITLRSIRIKDRRITYIFEPKVPALAMLLKYLRNANLNKKKIKVIVDT